MVKINRVAHVVLNARDPEESVKWYCDVLGMELLHFNSQMGMAFLSFGTSDHDIALIKAPEGVEPGSPGLSHTALQIEGGKEELRTLYKKLLDSGTRIDFLTDHGLTRSIYLFDPDGNRLEVFYQVLHGEEAKQFMREGRAGLAPYELEPTTAS